MIQTDIGLSTDFDYDEKNRLKLIRSEWDGAPGAIYSQQFHYRDDDLIEQISGNDANRYRHDGIKQLIFEETENLTSDYDRAGNRKYREDKTAISASPENEYSELNRLEEDKKIAATFAYDDNGNLIDQSGGDRLFYFDGNDRLRRIVKAGDYQIDYLYDEEGKLVKRKTEDLGTADVENTEFSYIKGKPIIIKRNGRPFMLVTWEPNGKLLRFRKPDSVIGGIRDKSLFPVYDGFGDIIRLFGSDRRQIAALQYDAWGNIGGLHDPDNHFEFLGYRGGVHDKLAGILLFGDRWYFPRIGRWISDDPIENSFSETVYKVLANLYRYSYNDPINLFDPSGLVPISMVPDELIKNARTTINSVTNKAFSDPELNTMTELIIDTISVNPFSDLFFKNALSFGDINPNAKPLIISKRESKFLNNLMKELLDDEDLSPKQRNIVAKAQSEFNKAIKAKTVVVLDEKDITHLEFGR